MTYKSMLHLLDTGGLDPQSFSHRAHVGVAWEALEEGDFFAASARFAAGLRRLVQIAGVPEKFNATITHAFLCAIAERRGQCAAADVETFLKENPDLLNGAFLHAHYSPERLSSPLARDVPLMPDRSGAQVSVV